MNRGRKNLKRAVEDEMSTLVDGHSVMQVVSLRGSNIIEVMDSKGEKLIAIFPAKFQKSMWIRIGNFVVVDESGREEAVESGRKVAGMVTQVLYHDQVRLLKKSSEWPEIFKPVMEESINQSTCSSLMSGLDIESEGSSSEDDGLPPLEANTNRVNPLFSELEIESESDTE